MVLLFSFEKVCKRSDLNGLTTSKKRFLKIDNIEVNPLVMIDDPQFYLVFRHFAEKEVPLVRHLAEQLGIFGYQ